MDGYYVYILASRRHGTLYVGVTNDLIRRVYEHREKLLKSFTSRHDVTRLVYFETFDDPLSAITREKQIKGWKRDYKVNIIEQSNPYWTDLYPTLV
ncbi:GIY-YIG nuclease family protein [Hansschlegelia quercus]|uniref:GIY-YIG nuclease family protein n=1 Tax=Hansschlegelia quercus TaxID=2528245 RepID=A0A4Q9GM52_9HYPH|nr:GIY-YIG nuclease family protein [Hansschlegelia quercus]TBN54195.1 GIY-YIG nuclease family protein [Hansschlegelia quercus]